jgi:hypothetical protein
VVSLDIAVWKLNANFILKKITEFGLHNTQIYGTKIENHMICQNKEG